jgi:lysophospholipase L1-like esterase
MTFRSRLARPCLLLAAVLVACDPGGAVGAAIEPQEVPEVIRYVALGDSIAVGTGAETSYVDEYASWLEQETGSRVTVTNRGVNGWTTTDVLEELRRDEALRAAVAEAHLVTLNAGGNDLLQALGELAAGRCGGHDGERCLREAVERLDTDWRELLAEVAEVAGGDLEGVRVLDLYRPSLLDVVPPERTRTLQHHLEVANERLAAGAAAAGIPIGRVHDAFEREGHGAAGLVAPDLIHPSDRGHQIIAEELSRFGVELRDPRRPAALGQV